MDIMANIEDPDEIRHNAAFHQGLYYLIRIKQNSETETQHYSDTSTYDPLKYIIGSPILVVSICMRNPPE